MRENIFNSSCKNGVYLNTRNYESKKTTRLQSIYDAGSDNTVVMVNFDRATVYEAKEFYDYVQELINDGKRKIVVDLDNVYFIDSVFFGTLIKVLKRVNKENGFVKLIVDYNSKPELLSISNFDEIFEIFPNLFEAISNNKAS